MQFSEQMANLAKEAKAWPFVEARALQERLAKTQKPNDKPVLFETGYGPSGLPHIGTFGEVVRTTMVRHAFEVLTGRPTRLVCFSDDMDGLRKVPDNVPNKELLATKLNIPLTKIPDPFGTHDSYGAHNNARLQAFLDGFGFEYEFVSATEIYQSGAFDEGLLHLLSRYDKVKNVVLPTLGEERRKTYSPFLPLCPKTGQVLLAKVIATDVDAGTITYIDPNDGEEICVPVTGGHCKLQWKADWGMRWYALGVDYEMYGKDLIEAAKLSAKITQVLGSTPPAGLPYELFLDQNGEKISKSRGNGLSVEEWLAYGSPESLSLFMYGQPKRAKRLYFDSIPKAVDEYYSHLAKAETADDAALLENPVFHIASGRPESQVMPLSFSLLLNLAAVCSASSADILWSYISDYAPGTSAKTHPELNRLAGYAVQYYQDKVRTAKSYRAPTDAEKLALGALRDALAELPEGAAAEDIQSAVYAVGKAAGYENLRDWFGCLYETLLGQAQGPRMGGFFTLYGKAHSMQLIEDAQNGKLVS